MTKKEKAVQKLTQIRDYYDQLDLDEDREDDEDPTDERDTLDALNMAIKALEKEPCEDAISREDAIGALEYQLEITSDDGFEKYKPEIKQILNTIYDVQKKQIQALPPATPIRPKGEWIKNDYQGVQAVGFLTYHCSECGREISSKYHGKISLLKEYPYCHCGAKMVKPQKSEVKE